MLPKNNTATVEKNNIHNLRIGIEDLRGDKNSDTHRKNLLELIEENKLLKKIAIDQALALEQTTEKLKQYFFSYG